MISALLGFYSASSLKEQSGKTLSRFRTNQLLLLFLDAACLAEKQQIPIPSLWFYQAGTQTHPTWGEQTNNYTIDDNMFLIIVYFQWRR
jgi:hypothetical protein